MASFEKIDYRLRPAKAVERKMIVDTIRKLSFFHNIENYRYIGFGSIYFADFILFHKALGISDMISIEHSLKFENRVKFNTPYSCIEVYCGSSNEVLPSLKWDKPSIVWLDYDFSIDSSMLSDINTVCTSVPSGSLIIITVNANPEKLPDGKKPEELQSYRYEKLLDSIGEERIPMGVDGSHLNAKKLSKVLRTILMNEISSNLKDRNGLEEDEGEKLYFNQIFNFKYEDGAKMLTIGGIILKNSQQELIAQARFKDLNFLSYDDKEYNIEIPMLTLREIKHIDSVLHKHLSCIDGVYKLKEEVKSEYEKFLEEEDILKYNKIYRYYPNFTESIL